jgi:hypothetical protein
MKSLYVNSYKYDKQYDALRICVYTYLSNLTYWISVPVQIMHRMIYYIV